MPVTIDMLALCRVECWNSVLLSNQRDSGEAFPQGSVLHHGEPTNEDLSRVGVS